jgi:hypothetical protein
MCGARGLTAQVYKASKILLNSNIDNERSGKKSAAPTLFSLVRFSGGLAMTCNRLTKAKAALDTCGGIYRYVAMRTRALKDLCTLANMVTKTSDARRNAGRAGCGPGGRRRRCYAERYPPVEAPRYRPKKSHCSVSLIHFSLST